MPLDLSNPLAHLKVFTKTDVSEMTHAVSNFNTWECVQGQHMLLYVKFNTICMQAILTQKLCQVI